MAAIASWRRRLGLLAVGIGGGACVVVLVGVTWAVLWIHHDRAHLTRVSGTVVRVNSSKRETIGRAPHFGRYSLNVQYRDPGDGSVVRGSVDERTYGFPSAGDSITLLIDPKTGHIESSPFPELWVVLGMAYLVLGGLIWFFVKAGRLAWRSVDSGAGGRTSVRDG